jgi:hypothetical protein
MTGGGDGDPDLAIATPAAAARSVNHRPGSAPSPFAHRKRALERTIGKPRVRGRIRVPVSMLGAGVFGYIRELRMLRARELLQRNCMPIKTIAAELGFRSTGHLTRAVKQHYGMTRVRNNLNTVGRISEAHPPSWPALDALRLSTLPLRRTSCF